MAAQSASDVERLIAAAMAEHKAGRLDAAEASWRAALALYSTAAGQAQTRLAPGRAAILHNLGVVVAAQGRHADALALFEAALATEPQYASAHHNRGVALEALGQSRAAIDAYRRAAVLEPGHYDAHRALGFLWQAEGDRGRALDHFARTHELRRGEDRTGMAQHSLTHATQAKLLHDAGQFRYLSSSRRDSKRFEMLARLYETVAAEIAETDTQLSDSQLDMLGEDYNTAIALSSAPECPGGAVSVALDTAGITRAFKAPAAGAVAIDGLLTPAALAGLQRYLLESTIWHDFSHIGGFVASYLEDGLACPLVLQIADEIRGCLPELLGRHPLSQAWAFKGLHSLAAIDAHADDAAISVNFWVTPDAANLSPGGGGLSVCRTSPPAARHVRGYDADKQQIAAFLDAHAAESLVVPYAENRAVLFQSRLFHRSDAPRFAAGYENHRINLTLLYGRHGR